MGKIIKVHCFNGHFFNSEKFDKCPICGAASIESTSDATNTFEVVSPGFPQRADNDESDVINPVSKAIEIKPTEQLINGTQKPSRTADTTEKRETDPIQDDKKNEVDPENNSTSLAQAIRATSSTTASALPKTVAIYNFDTKEPPVGWLICIKGSYQGTAFECKAGKNRIGRGADMGINLADDISITRDVHALLIYEPNNRIFFIQNGTGDGMVYVNGEFLFSHTELHAYDKVTLGKLDFVFLPLCGDQFTWDDYIEKEDA